MAEEISSKTAVRLLAEQEAVFSASGAVSNTSTSIPMNGADLAAKAIYSLATGKGA
jgi:hypothetical protein